MSEHCQEDSTSKLTAITEARRTLNNVFAEQTMGLRNDINEVTERILNALYEAGRKNKSLPDELLSIGEQLRTQDNRATQHPMFCVQEKRRLVGVDAAYSDKRCWLDSANEHTVYDDDKDFDAVKWALEKSSDYDEFGYVDQWFTVMVSFTEEGCKQYLRLNGHNHRGETRIYVESFNRCPEMIVIREFLMSIS